MPDVTDSWIQPHHLDEVTQTRYRAACAASPARMLVLADFLHEDRAKQLASFLAEDAEYERKFGLRTGDDDNAVEESRWLAATDEERFFRFSQLSGIRPEARLGLGTLAYMQFRAAFAEPGFRAVFEAITGLALAYARDDVGVHALHAGDFLRPHDDDNRGRRLAIVLYLTPGWRPELGGMLRVVPREGEAVAVPPTFNSLVMFDTRSGATHEVTPVSSAAGDLARRTVGGWYHDAGAGT